MRYTRVKVMQRKQTPHERILGNCEDVQLVWFLGQTNILLVFIEFGKIQIRFPDPVNYQYEDQKVNRDTKQGEKSVESGKFAHILPKQFLWDFLTRYFNVGAVIHFAYFALRRWNSCFGHVFFADDSCFYPLDDACFMDESDGSRAFAKFH